MKEDQTMPNPLIGLSGYSRSGKDTLAAFLAPHGYHRLSFADNLRDLAYQTNPLILPTGNGMLPLARRHLDTEVNVYGWERAKESADVREFLQNLGVAARNVLGEDVWVDALHRQRQPGTKYVITDVRFPNEAAYIRQRGGLLVRVTRPGTGPVNGHESESALDNEDFDVHILNDGSREELGSFADLLVLK